jgi:hypothetical protein
MAELTSKGNDKDFFANVGPTNNANEGYGVAGDTDKDGLGQGVGGLKHSDFLGWENTTVGLASNVLNRLVSQNGIQPTDPNILGAREPFRVGRFLIKWVKMPPFFHPTARQYLRLIFEDMVKSVDGVPANSVSEITTTNGAVQATASHPGIYKENGNSMTLAVDECSGMPVRKLLDYWITGISDRKTGVMHMYGKKMRGITANVSGSFIYVLLGPTCRPDDIEFACMLHECWPAAEQTSHANSGTMGDAGSGTSLSIEFKGMYDRGPEIDMLARKIVEGYKLYGQSYFNQLLPSYIYDDALMSASSDDVSKAMSVAIDDRLKNAAADSNSGSPYTTDEIGTDGRGAGRGILRAGITAEPIIETTAGSFGEMGRLSAAGSSDTIVGGKDEAAGIGAS